MCRMISNTRARFNAIIIIIIVIKILHRVKTYKIEVTCKNVGNFFVNKHTGTRSKRDK